MKKAAMLLLLTVFLMLTCLIASAENPEENALTAANCPELAEILLLKNPADPKISEFAEKFAGRTIAFDGWIADIANHGSYKTRYDVLIYVGDYDENSLSGPNFQFSDVNLHEMGIEDLYLPSYMAAGNSVRVVAKVDSYNSSTELFRLTPVLVKERTEVAETIELPEEVHYTALKNGSKGDDVKALQNRLIELYYLPKGSADGAFGKKTKAAVERFQSSNNLDATGIADEETQRVLYSSLAKEATLSISNASMVIGSNATTQWSVDGQTFTLKGKQTKTIKTVWGTYRFDAFGNYEKIE